MMGTSSEPAAITPAQHGEEAGGVREVLNALGLDEGLAAALAGLDSPRLEVREQATVALAESPMLPTGVLFLMLQEHRSIFTPEQFERLLDIAELRYLTSIAVIGIQMDSRRPDQGITIQHIFPGAPAERLLRTGDIMLAIDGKPLLGLDSVRVIQETVGGRWPGDTINLRIARPLEPGVPGADPRPDLPGGAGAGGAGAAPPEEDAARADEPPAGDAGAGNEGAGVGGGEAGEGDGVAPGGQVVGDGIKGHLIIDLDVQLANASELTGFDSPTLSGVRLSAWETMEARLRPPRVQLNSIDVSGKLDASSAGPPGSPGEAVDAQIAAIQRLVARAQEVLADMRDLQARLRQYEPQSELAEELRDRLREVSGEYQQLREQLSQLGYNPDGTRLRTTYRRSPTPVLRAPADNPPAGGGGSQ